MRALNRDTLGRLLAATADYAAARGRCAAGALPPPHYVLDLEHAALLYQQSRDQSAERLGRAVAPAVAPGGAM